MARKFDTIVESFMRRVNQNTFIVNDRVKFIGNYLQHEWTRKQPGLKVDRLKELVESGHNIRISAIKTNRPVTAQTGHFEAVDDIWYDIVREEAPGLYTQVFTVPQEMLELIDDYPNEAPIPDSLRRDDNSNIKPEQVNIQSEDDMIGPTHQTRDGQPAKELPDSNTTLPDTTKPTEGESYTKQYIDN
tara:strand:- start:139 stop:702 length:564 start_codon:yes stop_codon:yes gene_type:complete